MRFFIFAFASVVVLSASAHESCSPRKRTCAEVKWTRPICVEENRYIGWPTVCRRSNGEILVVFSGDRDGHVCPWGKVQLVRSTDDGETWSAPRTIVNSLPDDRDAGLLEASDGSLVLKWFTSTAWMAEEWTSRLERKKEFVRLDCYRRHFEKLPKDLLARELGSFTSRSTDGGETWSERIRTEGSAPHGGIRLRDGRLLLVGRRSGGKPVQLTVEESTDNAMSWRRIGTVGVPDGEDVSKFCEPHVCEYADGELLAAFRHTVLPNEIRTARSTDGGRTWTPAMKTGVFGLPPHLLVLKDGFTVMVYCKRLKDQWGEYAVWSEDRGLTWDIAHEFLLAPHFSNDLGYPSTVDLGNGELLTTYYQAVKPGEKPCLMATKWRVMR